MGVLDMLKEVLIGAAGIGVGYLIARNTLEKKYAHLLDVEIQRTKEFFAAETGYEGSKEGLDDPEFMQGAIDAAEAMTHYTNGEIVVQPSVLAQEMERTVAKGDPTEENPYPRGSQAAAVRAQDESLGRVAYNKPGAPTIEEEVRDIESNVAATPLDPNAREPYIITFAEFDANETGAEQITVSFFAGDGIVIDEVDEVIKADRVEQLLGTANLNRFGTNKEDPDMDPNVLWIRCERFNMDFEVNRSPGKHSVEVLGETG